MKTAAITVASLLLWVGQVAAQGTTIYPTIPGTPYRDYTQPAFHVDPPDSQGRTFVYPTLPGIGARDYTRPGLVIEPPRAQPFIGGLYDRDGLGGLGLPSFDNGDDD